MATLTWEYYSSGSGAWVAMGYNTLVFSSGSGIDSPVTPGIYAEGVHLGNAEPGTDQCGVSHMNHILYIDSTHFSTSGSGSSEVLNDTNLVAAEATVRIHFNHDVAVRITAGRFYVFDGALDENPAPDVIVYGHEIGVASEEWTLINYGSADIGGDNAGQRLALYDHTIASMDHYWYVALAATPENAGAKYQFELGIQFQYG